MTRWRGDPTVSSHERVVWRTILSLFLAAVSACEEQAVETRTAALHEETIDGVTYLRHSGQPPVADLQLETAVGIGADLENEASPYELGRVESVLADSEGTLYVADGIGLEIRVFARDGRYLRTLGHEGQGPGELGGIHGIAWLGEDTIVVMDYGNARLSRMATDGQVIGQWPWMRLTGSGRYLFNGGADDVFAHTFRPRHDGEPLRSAWVRYTNAGPSDTLDIPEVDSRRGSSARCRGDGIGSMSNPFGDRLISRPAPARERVLVWSSQYRLAFIDALGDTTRVLTRNVLPTVLTDSLWQPIDSAYARFRTAWAGADCEGEITRPSAQPVVLDAGFDHDGRLWVEYNTDSGRVFDVFTAGGKLEYTFAAPDDRDRSVAPFIRGDRVYLVLKDAFDVQTVHAYRLTPPRPLAGGRPRSLQPR